MRSFLTLPFVCLTALAAQAQETIINPVPADTSRRQTAPDREQSRLDNKVFANPSVLGMGPSKGLILRYERAPDFGITSAGQKPEQHIGNGSGQIQKLNVLTFKLYAPLWNHPHLKVVVGFNYEKQQFNLEHRDTITYPLYRVIDNRNLRTVGSQLVVLRPIDGRRYWLVRVKGELNGDYTKDRRSLPLTHYLKTTAEAFYGWKRSPSESVAIGAQYGYTFGRISLYPAIIYNRTWNTHWGFEGLLPAKARVRYNVTERTLFYGGYEVEGNAYTINIGTPLSATSADRTAELRRTDIAGKLRVEQEVLPFLWVAAEAGYRYYASFDVFDSSASRNKLIDSSLKNSALVNVEVFVTPPRKRLLKQ
jgi:hypothetical protein